MSPKYPALPVLLALPLTAAAIDLLDPRLAYVNQFAMPSEVTAPLGDLEFSSDGATAWLISASGSDDASVWRFVVERDDSGVVTGFSAASQLFADAGVDTGLTLGPNTQTFVYRTSSLGITQRFEDDATEDYSIVNYSDAGGGLAFVPGAFSQAGNIVSTSCGGAYLHQTSPDGDGSFTINAGQLYADLSLLGSFGICVGDLEFLTESRLAPAMLFAADGGGGLGEVFSIELDPGTGEPVDGTQTSPTPLIDGLGAGAAWGLAVDPVNNNLFVIERDGANADIFQFSLNRIFRDRFEP